MDLFLDRGRCKCAETELLIQSSLWKSLEWILNIFGPSLETALEAKMQHQQSNKHESTQTSGPKPHTLFKRLIKSLRSSVIVFFGNITQMKVILAIVFLWVSKHLNLL